MRAPSPGSFPSQLLLLSSVFSVCIGILGRSSEPHLFSLFSLTWYFICFQKLHGTNSPVYISSSDSSLEYWIHVFSGIPDGIPLGCLIIIANLTYPKQNLDFQFFHIKILCVFRYLVVSDPLWPPWIIASQSPLSMRFSRQEYWSGLPCPSPGDLPNPGIKAGSPVLQAYSLLSEPSGKLKA